MMAADIAARLVTAERDKEELRAINRILWQERNWLEVQHIDAEERLAFALEHVAELEKKLDEARAMAEAQL